VYMCAYTVNIDGKCPFLRYLLTTHIGVDEKINFPMVPKLSALRTIREYVDYAYICLNGLLLSHNDNNTSDGLTFTGYYVFNGNIYLFYNVTACSIQLYDIYRSNNSWFVLIDEIANHQHMCNIPIDSSVVGLFIKNPELCFLTDKNNNQFECPITGYVPKYENKLSFTCTFGQVASNKNSIFGPFFYFSDFITSFSAFEIGDPFRPISNNLFGVSSSDKTGIVRFAIFMGLSKVIDNLPGDAVDESNIKRERLDDNNLDTITERLTMRVSDHDGNWAQNYDSVYLGPIELDNGTHLKCNLIAIKNYNQQVPLSYHYVNKKIGECDPSFLRIE